MSEFDITEQLVRYLDGEMTPEEQAKWKLQIAADATMREELDALRLAREAVQFAGTSDTVHRVHQEFVSARQEESVPAPVVRSMGRQTLWRAAAAVAALVMLTAGWWMNQTTDRAIYADHFVNFSVSASRDQVSKDQIGSSFREGNYKAVIELSGKGPLGAQDSLLTGIAYFQLKQFEPAVSWLRPLSVSGAFAEDATYYLAFALLGKGDDAEALALFEKIQADPSHLYHAAVTSSLIRKVKFRTW